MASKNLDVGVKYTGDAKGFKRANDEARREAAKLRKEAIQNSQDMERKFKAVAMTIAKLGAAFVVAQQAAKLYAAAMNTTEGSADKLEEQIGYLQGAVQGAFTTLFSGDWLDLIDNIKRTAAATRDLAKAEDQLADAKARNQITRGDLDIQLQATKIAAAEETDPARKRSLLQDAISIQKQITALNVSEIQKRIDAEEQYYKSVFNASDDYWSFIKSNLLTIIKNYDTFYSQQEANAKRLSDLNYMAGATVGGLTPAQQKEREGLIMLQALMRDYITLQDELSKKGQWQAFLGMLGEVRQAAADGDAAILRLTKQVTTLGETVSREAAKFGHGTESLIPMVGGAAGSPSLSQVEGMNQLATATQQATASLIDYQNISSMLEGSFANMFSAGIEGWDEFGQAAANAIKQMLVKLAALAATYAVLSMFPGFAAFLELMGGFKGFMMQGMGFATNTTKSASVASSGGQLALRGRDIAYANYRATGSLGRIT